ncbi:hypothetical protein ABLE68_08260 [Nocardioides sp. CN2-186]|uniref:hypothetical protein n=1 Tax=Nocardioides tweenelious TaxID=3156607 RepID=UPI0032B42624
MPATRITGASRAASLLVDDIDEYGDPCFRWPRRDQQTLPPLDAGFCDAAHIVIAWTPTNLPNWTNLTAHVRNVYFAENIGELVEGSWIGFTFDAPDHRDLQGLADAVTAGLDLDYVSDTNSGADIASEVGAPSSALLVEAVAQLRSWLSMRQQDLATYLRISNSTIMSWKREAPQYPRHPNIPALLSLWSALASARAELGDAATSQLVWNSGTDNGAPAVPADDLIELLIGAATAASDAAWLEDDGYVPGQTPLPAADHYLENETALSEHLDLVGGGQNSLDADTDDEPGAPEA